jgi:acyl dehydratase
MADSRFATHVGRTSAPRTYPVEVGHISRFAESLGDANPIYHDVAAARAAGHANLIAPPTFAIALRPNDPRDGLDLDFRKLLHGEQSFELMRPLYAGDTITVVGEIVAADCKETKSGIMDTLTTETRGTSVTGELVFVTRSTVLVKR